MTIEVLERGTLPSERVYVERCMHCKSQLRFKEKDAEMVSDRNATLLKIHCPVCNGEVYANLRR